MSKFNTRTLTGKGSVTFHGPDGVVSYAKGDTVESAKAFKAIPERQQVFFTEVKAEDKVKVEGDDLAAKIDEDFTVEELQDELKEYEVDYTSDARKPDLVQLYLKHVAETDAEEE